MCALCPWMPDGIRAPGVGVPGHCEPLCGCWEPNPGPLLKCQVLLTTGQPPQLLKVILKHYNVLGISGQFHLLEPLGPPHTEA